MIGTSIYMTTPPPDIHITLPHLDLSMAERRLISEALLCTKTLVEAAALLGINRQTLRRLISKHSIEWWPHAQQLDHWRRRARRKAARANASGETSLKLSLHPVLSPASRSP